MARNLCEIIYGKKYSKLTAEELAQFRRYNRMASYYIKHEVNKTRQRLRLQAIKSRLIAALGWEAKCMRCGYSRSILSLDFHHRDHTEKLFTINGASISQDVLAEAKKCDLICANCHREIHANGTGTQAGPKMKSGNDPILKKFIEAYRKNAGILPASPESSG